MRLVIPSLSIHFYISSRSICGQGGIRSPNSSGINPSDLRASPALQAFAMAEVTYTNEITPAEESVDAGDTVLQANPPRTEESGTKSTATTDTGAIMPQMPATQALTQEMSAAEALEQGDLAMESNPMTTAEAPSVEHRDSSNNPSAAVVAVKPSPAYSGPSVSATGAEDPSGHSYAHGNATEPPYQRETSATGWLVPPAATPFSKITFDGTLLPFVFVYLVHTVASLSM